MLGIASVECVAQLTLSKHNTVIVPWFVPVRKHICPQGQTTGIAAVGCVDLA
jgi:hypothetical protein